MSDIIDLMEFAAERAERRAEHGIFFHPRHDATPARPRDEAAQSLAEFLIKREAMKAREAADAAKAEIEAARKAYLDEIRQRHIELNEQAEQDLAATPRAPATLRFNTARLRQIGTRQSMIGVTNFIMMCRSINALGHLVLCASWLMLRFVPSQHKHLPFSDPEAVPQEPHLRLVGAPVEERPRNMRLRAYHATRALADKMIMGSRRLMQREADKAEVFHAEQTPYVMLLSKPRHPTMIPTIASAVVFQPPTRLRKWMLNGSSSLNNALFPKGNVFAFR